MDSSLQKPFACKSSGCNLSFINEDHLNIHEKKHEMILTLENKGTNVFLVDQTPTPTKLIKNCEEVGLFEDLRNVNPFDETFRRAVEKTKTNLLNCTNNSNNDAEHKILHLNEDTLHTPQVFPNQTDEANSNCQDFRIDKEKIILSTNLDKKRKTPVKQIDENSNKSTKRQISLTELVLKSNATKNTKSSPPIQSVTERILMPASLKTSTILPNMINLIQPQNITWQPTKKLILPKPITVITSKNHSPEQHIEISVKERLKAIIINNDKNSESNQNNNEQRIISSNKNIKQNDKQIKIRKQTNDCLERRREAAVRYRKRKHIQQCDLQKRNAELLAENLELKSKIKQLQETLNAHQNCDLTKTTIKTSPNGITAQLLMKSVPLIQIPASTIVMKIPKLLIKPGDIQF